MQQTVNPTADSRSVPVTSRIARPACRAAIEERSNWSSFRTGAGTRVHLAGDRQQVENVVKSLDSSGLAALDGALLAADGHFAGVIERPNEIVAFADHCRSIPIVYDASGNISNSAALLKRRSGLEEGEPLSLLEFAMAGYVTGHRTLFRGLSQLQAGEVLVWPKAAPEPDVRRYYRYVVGDVRRESAAVLREEIGAILDRSVKRLIADAAGRSVWLALSGGLDSRILLCKLIEHGCPNLNVFSYGLRFNDELRIGRDVARRLNVHWIAVPSTGSAMRQYFHSDTRRQWWDFASNMASVPGPSGALTLAQMIGKGVLKPGDMIVNGQSGDFITGAHIPAALRGGRKSAADLLKAIVGKHFSLWRSLKSPENLETIHQEMLRKLGIGIEDDFSEDEACALYESHEYDERQAKYVINAQRNYEFFGLDWRFPLWDREFADFWRGIPAAMKFKRVLFRDYLDEYDYGGVFRQYKPAVSHWPWPGKSLLPISRLIRLSAGTAARDRFMKRADYYGIYHYLYAAIGPQAYQRHAHDARNPISFFAAILLRENGLQLPAGLQFE